MCLSFCSFAIEIPGGRLIDRLQITLGLVLTAAAFKIVIAGFTPAVGYLTLLDLYVLLCFAFMTAIAACNVIVSMAPSDEVAHEWNWNLGVYMAIAYVGAHALLPIAKWRSRRAHAREVRAADASEAANVRRWVVGALNRRMSLKQFAGEISSMLSADASVAFSVNGKGGGSRAGGSFVNGGGNTTALLKAAAGSARDGSMPLRRSLDGVRVD